MLILQLSAHDGGTAWRHLLAHGEARSGFEPVGPLGLARRVGRILGIPAQAAGAPERLAAYARLLDAHDDGTRSYSASRLQDPFGVARYLLGLRDELRTSAWDGRAIQASARLRDLAELESQAATLPAGIPDVLRELVDGVRAAGKLPVAVRVELGSPRGSFRPLVLRLLDVLSTAGAVVTDPPARTALAAASTDLGRLQRALLEPKGGRPSLAGDGSFRILEADTPHEAAELVASLARTLDPSGATWVVPTEPATLDAALARQGLATLGLPSTSRLHPHLQVLPLRLTLAFRPQDPFRAAELLLLPGAPLASHAQRQLLAALNEMPGVGSPAWLAAIDESVADEVAYATERGEKELAAKGAGAALRARIDDWFGGELHDPVEGIPASRAAQLCAMVAKWAGGRVAGAHEEAESDPASAAGDDASLWGQAAAVARVLEQVVLARPADERLNQQRLMQLHDIAAGSGSDLSAFDGEAGRPALASTPDGVTVPSDDVVWWGFVLDAGASTGTEPWTGGEREALLQAGVTLPAPGERRHIEALAWRQPLLSARARAVLVRWRLAGAAAAAPHAFLDELSTLVAPGSLAACTVRSERVLQGDRGNGAWQASAVDVAPQQRMAQRPVWTVPAATLAPTSHLSATSLDTYLGCPFRWALQYQANLRPGGGGSIPEGDQLLGSFAHRLLQDMLCGPSKLTLPAGTAADAKAWAARAFDARVAVEAAPLVRRGGEVELDRARTLVADAAGALVEFLRRTGWRPVDTERKVTGSFAGLPASGSIDLVVEKGGVEAVIDLKLAGLKRRLAELEKGHVLQTALYASMLRKPGKELPPSGFFVLAESQFVTADPQAFPGATVVEGPGAGETLQGAEEGFAYWSRVLARGVLPVLRADLPWEAAVTAAAGPPPEEESLARREPPCRYCDYRSVCVPATNDSEEVGA